MAEIKFLLKFGKREHLESLVKGSIYCSNAITFWGIEDKLKSRQKRYQYFVCLLFWRKTVKLTNMKM